MGLISWTLFIPLLGAILIMFIPSNKSDDEKSGASKFGWIALAFSSLSGAKLIKI